MKIDISVVREIYIPLPEYPHAYYGDSLAKGISLLSGNRSSKDHPKKVDSLLVINEAGEFLGLLDHRSVLKNFFRPAIRPLTSQFPLKDRDSYADTIIAIDEWFKCECQRKSTAIIGEFLSIPQPLHSVTPTCHAVEALDLMLKTDSDVLPVLENNVLLGAVRLEDLFTTLAKSYIPEFKAKYTFSTEG